MTSAAIVKPCAKPESKGKLAVKCEYPPIEVTVEMGTVTGRFCPEMYTIEFVSGPTSPGAANSNVIFWASGVVTTSKGPNVFNPPAVRVAMSCGQEPGTINVWSAVNAKLGDPPVRKGAAEAVFFWT